MTQLFTWSYGLLCFLMGAYAWNEIKKWVDEHTDSFYKRQNDRLKEAIEELVDIVEENYEEEEEYDE